ncbi:MAG: 3-methyl-2-oxobutanoate hydroxymethyltransferase [Gemmatimonadota bacterium]|nr:MAG: 3-methyl-2-oxobutanoate hydroxymethyltransferase [Gemmatimonadota bacterium]
MPEKNRPVRTLDIRAMKEAGDKIVALTAYDALFGSLVDESGADIILVGDSVNTVLCGRDTTLSATLDQMIYHGSIVRRGVRRALLTIDMPYLSYQVSIEDAKRNCGRVMKETGAEAVKLEGGRSVAPTVEALVEIGIPVMGHVGFTPQSVHAMGGHRVQGRKAGDRERIVEDAKALERAGAFSVVLELMPSDVAQSVTEAINVPTIGIGSGPHCDGQVLVLHDMLGLNDRFSAKFLKRYANLADSVRSAVKQFEADVRSGRYPDSSHTYE